MRSFSASHSSFINAFFTLHLPLFLNEDSLDAGADASEDFVWDGADGIAEDGDREVVAKDGDLVACLAVDTCDIYHAYVHADIAEIRGFLSIHEAIAIAVAKTTIESVGITNWNGCHTSWTVHEGLATIADGIACWHVANLKNRGFQRCHIVNHFVVAWIHTIETESETNHVEMVLREMLNARRIADVADNLMAISGLKLRGSLVVEFELTLTEIIEFVVVASHKMREHATWHYG